MLHFLHSLRSLDLAGNSCTTIPASIEHISGLQFLTINRSKKLEVLPRLPESTMVVVAENCLRLEGISNPFIICTVPDSRFYFLNCSSLLPQDLDLTLQQKYSLSLLHYILCCSMRMILGTYVVSPCLQCEIPEWFSYQAVGPLLSIDMPPNWHDNSWRGFAICASFKRINHSPCQDLENDHFIFCGFHADGNQLGPLFKFPIRFVNSGCLWLGHVLDTQFPYDTKWETMSNLIVASFTITNPWLEVEKCGVHLVYELDPAKFDDISVRLSSSSPRDWDRIYHELRPPRKVNRVYRGSIAPELYKVNDGVMSCGVFEVQTKSLNDRGLLFGYQYAIWCHSKGGQLSVHDLNRRFSDSLQMWWALIRFMRELPLPLIVDLNELDLFIKSSLSRSARRYCKSILDVPEQPPGLRQVCDDDFNDYSDDDSNLIPIEGSTRTVECGQCSIISRRKLHV